MVILWQRQKLYTCSECGYKTPKWFGKCPSCNSWDSLEEAIDMPVSFLKAASTWNNKNKKTI